MFEFISQIVATQPIVIDTISNSVGNITAHIGEFLLIAGLIAGYIAAHTKAGKAHNLAIEVGKMATMSAQKTIENIGRIKTVTDVGVNLSGATDEQKQTLTKVSQNLDEALSVALAQIDRLKPLLPAEAQVDNIVSLPRESFPTKTVQTK